MDDAKLKRAAEGYEKAVKEAELAAGEVREATLRLAASQDREKDAREAVGVFAHAMREAAAPSGMTAPERRHYCAVLGRFACAACVLDDEPCGSCQRWMALVATAADLAPATSGSTAS